MLARHLAENAPQHAERVALTHGALELRYADIAARSAALTRRWRDLAGRRVALTVVAPDRFIPSVIALDSLGAQAFLLGRRDDDELERVGDVLRWDQVLEESDASPDPGSGAGPFAVTGNRAGLVTLLTSGTTGSPKCANHTWATLAAPVRRRTRPQDDRWLCVYPLPLYAGIQVFLQSFVNWSTLAVPLSLEARAVARFLVERRITHASGTPTFWRQLLFFGGHDLLRESGLRQITLGGEASTQDLLDRLRVVFPAARIVHIYASTELGRLFSVADGREGFPVAFLRHPPPELDGLAIIDGELHARSRNAMLGYDGQQPLADRDDGWFATGDLVEVRDDRVLFRGRTTEIINVGGHKVAPGKVEGVLRAVKGVADLRVFGARSSLAGQLVAAEVVLAPDVDEDGVRRELQRVARERLATHEIPRKLRFVAAIDRSAGFKVIRRETK